MVSCNKPGLAGTARSEKKPFAGKSETFRTSGGGAAKNAGPMIGWSLLSLVLLVVLPLRMSLAQTKRQTSLDQLRAAVRQAPDSAEARNELGAALGEAGDLAQAITELETAVRLKPDYAEALYNLGITHLKRVNSTRAYDDLAYYDDLDKALQLLQRAQTLQSDLPNIHNHLGTIYLQTANISSAQHEFQQAIRRDPTSAEAHNNLGLTLVHRGKLDEARRAFQQAIELNPRLVGAHLNLESAIEHTRSGYTPAVVRDWEAMVRRQPTSAAARAHLGRALARTNRLSEAVIQLRRAVALMPDLAIAHFYLGQTLRQQGDLVSAARHLTTAIRLSPDNAEFQAELGLVLVQQNKTSEAVAALRKATQQDPMSPAANFALGQALLKNGQRDEATPYLEKAKALNESQKTLEDARAATAEGMNQLDAGKLDAAIQLFREALAKRPDHPEASCYLGIALAQKGDSRGAIEAFQTALKHAPMNGEIHYNFGLALIQFGKVGDAVNEFQLAVRLKPNDGLFHCALGKALVYQGDNQEGEKALQRARELGACRPEQSSTPCSPQRDRECEASVAVSHTARLRRLMCGKSLTCRESARPNSRGSAPHIAGAARKTLASLAEGQQTFRTSGGEAAAGPVPTSTDS